MLRRLIGALLIYRGKSNDCADAGEHTIFNYINEGFL
jgi:hypothetical protein